MLWNGTLDHTKVAGHPALARRLTVHAEGVTGMLRIWRVDADHDISQWRGGDWPDEEQWRTLAAAVRLSEAEPPHPFTEAATLELPMPGIAYLEIQPEI